jgi:hypothetical protein
LAARNAPEPGHLAAVGEREVREVVLDCAREALDHRRAPVQGPGEGREQIDAHEHRQEQQQGPVSEHHGDGDQRGEGEVLAHDVPEVGGRASHAQQHREAVEHEQDPADAARLEVCVRRVNYERIG